MAHITRLPSLSKGNRMSISTCVCMQTRTHETDTRNVHASPQAGLMTHTVFASTVSSQSVGKMCVHIHAHIRMHMHSCERMQIDAGEDEGTHAHMNFHVTLHTQFRVHVHTECGAVW